MGKTRKLGEEKAERGRAFEEEQWAGVRVGQEGVGVSDGPGDTWCTAQVGGAVSNNNQETVCHPPPLRSPHCTCIFDEKK